jgi:hypothetical protein
VCFGIDGVVESIEWKDDDDIERSKKGSKRS